MSNHVHCILSSETGSLSQTICDLKSFTSKKILSSIISEPESRRNWLLERFQVAGAKNKRNNVYQFWTNDNHAVELTTNEMIEQRVNYIHYNPVKAMIVTKPKHYYFSSCCELESDQLIPLTAL
jgi:REP element-mobilizing transposase RayT